MKTLFTKRPFQLTLGLLFIGIPFVLLQYSPLKSLHGASEIPLIVLIFALIGFLLSVILKFQTLLLTSTFGYPITFILGFIFQTNSPPTDSMSTNNLWKIWLISYWILLGAGLIIDFLKKFSGKKNRDFSH